MAKERIEQLMETVDGLDKTAPKLAAEIRNSLARAYMLNIEGGVHANEAKTMYKVCGSGDVTYTVEVVEGKPVHTCTGYEKMQAMHDAAVAGSDVGDPGVFRCKHLEAIALQRGTLDAAKLFDWLFEQPIAAWVKANPGAQADWLMKLADKNQVSMSEALLAYLQDNPKRIKGFLDATKLDQFGAAVQQSGQVRKRLAAKKAEAKRQARIEYQKRLMVVVVDTTPKMLVCDDEGRGTCKITRRIPEGVQMQDIPALARARWGDQTRVSFKTVSQAWGEANLPVLDLQVQPA